MQLAAFNVTVIKQKERRYVCIDFPRIPGPYPGGLLGLRVTPLLKLVIFIKGVFSEENGMVLMQLQSFALEALGQ